MSKFCYLLKNIFSFWSACLTIVSFVQNSLAENVYLKRLALTFSDKDIFEKETF